MLMRLDALAVYPGCTCFHMFVERDKVIKLNNARCYLDLIIFLVLLHITIAGIFQSSSVILRYITFYTSMYTIYKCKSIV